MSSQIVAKKAAEVAKVTGEAVKWTAQAIKAKSGVQGWPDQLLS